MRKTLIAGFATAFLMLGMIGTSPAALISNPTQLFDASVDIDFDSTFSDPNVTFTGPSFGFFNSTGFGAPITFPTFVAGNTKRVDPGTLTLTFSTPVFEVGFGLFDPNFTGTGFEAFDVSGNSLTGGFVQSPIGPPGGSFASYMGLRESSDIISSIVITAAAGDLLGLDNISFTVPEPASLVLLGFGLAGIGFSRRRKTAKTV